MAEKKNTTKTIVLTEHTYLGSAWLRKEFSKATDEETEMLIHKYENHLAEHLYKRTFFYIISAEGRNLKFITWLCDKLTETTGYMYEAKLVFNDKNQTAMVVIDENKESKEAYIKSRYVPETKKVDLAKEDKSNIPAETDMTWLGWFIKLSPHDVNEDFDFRTGLYYDNFTELVYMQGSSGFVPYYYGNYPMRYSKERRIFYFVTEKNIAHTIQKDIYNTFRWYA